MSCSSCKDKKDKLTESTEFVSKSVVWFTVVWSMLAVYGLVTLISKFL